MPVTTAYLNYVLEQLARVRALTSRRMFGGHGLYSDGAFFGLIDDDTLFFKTGDANRADYESRGMKRFMPSPGQNPSGGGMGYHEVPADVLEDAEQLLTWARKSVEIAVSRAVARQSKPARKRATRVKKKTRRTPRRRAASKRSNTGRRRFLTASGYFRRSGRGMLGTGHIESRIGVKGA